MYSNEHTTQMGFYKRSCQFSSFSLFLPVQQLLSVLKLLLNNMKVHCFSFHLDCFRRKTFWFLYIFSICFSFYPQTALLVWHVQFTIVKWYYGKNCTRKQTKIAHKLNGFRIELKHTFEIVLWESTTKTQHEPMNV